MKLHGYFRSTASWRVRIAMALKGVSRENIFHHLRRGEQRAPDYLALNPQGLLPALELDDGQVLTQSLAICEYLDETIPAPPLLPSAVYDRAHVRRLAQIIACDIHPVQNLKVLKRLENLGVDEAGVAAWARETISEGLDAFNAYAEKSKEPFAATSFPSLADICLVPQLANARRFKVDLRWPRLTDIEQNCMALPAFAETAPLKEADAE